MKITANCAGLELKEEQKFSNRILNVGDKDQVTSLKLTKTFSNNVDLRHMVDDNNSIKFNIQ